MSSNPRRFRHIMMALFLVVGTCVVIGYGQLQTHFEAPLLLSSPQAFTISPGDSAQRVIHNLSDQGVFPQTDPPLSLISSLINPLVYRCFLKIKGWGREIRSGEYTINPHDSLYTLFKKFTTGADIIHYPLTIPEGSTTHGIYQLLQSASFLSGEIDQKNLGMTDPHIFYWPETYHFPRGTSRQKVLEKLAMEGSSQLLNIWKKRSDQCTISSPKELLILGSIVEKETRLPHERPLVAQVFINRLSKKMPLQADPTVTYGQFLRDGRPIESPLTRKDLKEKTDYNTYVIPGLPIGPICHPGMASLVSLTHPEPGPFLYFVADGSGGHVFSATYTDHTKHHIQWRTFQRNRQARMIAEKMGS